MSDLIDIKGDDSAVLFENIDSIKCINNGLSIYNYGANNKIEIGKNVVFNNFNIRIDANECHIKIGDDCRLTGSVIMKLVDGNTLIIGDRTSVGGTNFICGEGAKIEIGKECMIAWGIEFRNTDSHAIFDLTTKKRINDAEDILIEDNVWIGAHATILKGTTVRKGSIISIRSVVTSKIDEPNVILGGVPAKIIKRNVYWERPLLG